MPQAKESSLNRGKQLAVLAAIAHEKATDGEIGILLEKALKDWEEVVARQQDVEVDANDNSDDMATVKRILELESDSYKKATCIPTELAARKAELEASAYSAWVKARETNDFATFAPALKDCFDTAKEIANLQRGGDNTISLYSQMLDEFEMGMPAERIDDLFGQVQKALVPLIATIRESENQPKLEALSGHFPIEAQKEACREIVTAIGFDETHGRIDVSVHPFTMSFSNADVRITSRFTETEWFQGLMGTIHEGGHAMYEQNLRGESDLSLDSALSMGVHESQSLFWERHIGKSRAFYEWAGPILGEAFGKDGEKFDYSAEELYAAVNAVDFGNFIRVDADELTYPLHVILRYNIERDVVAGKLDVNDVPTRWNAEMKSLLGIDVPDDANGCLQDIHWSCLAIGYFPTYLLGSMMAAQLAHHCKKDLPSMDEMIKAGEFGEIKKWLTKKVHVHGRRYKSLDDLLVAEIGEPLNSQYFIDYLTEKYRDLYKVE
jgi:carboxypeptidase Taq